MLKKILLLAITCISFFFWGCSSRLVELEEKIVEDVTEDIIEDVEEFVEPCHHKRNHLKRTSTKHESN